MIGHVIVVKRDSTSRIGAVTYFCVSVTESFKQTLFNMKINILLVCEAKQ